MVDKSWEEFRDEELLFDDDDEEVVVKPTKTTKITKYTTPWYIKQDTTPFGGSL